jgi:flagellar basal-body rod modification protein FlgD
MAGVPPVAGAGTQQTSSGASASGLGQQMNSSDFLSLLTTEMKNQDPMNPVDDTQSMAQLAQFSALSATEELNQSFQNFQSNFGVMQSASLIGKTVTVSTPDASGNSSTVTGTVGSIAVQNGQPYFTMNGSNGKPITDDNGQPLLFSTTEIVGIG